LPEIEQDKEEEIYRKEIEKEAEEYEIVEIEER
jgi:hypothetical protein